MYTNKKLAMASAVLAALSQTGSAVAQAPMLEEVVVTATKREQGMQDVPIAIAVMSGKRIEEQGIGELEDLTPYLPGVHVGESGGQNQLFIRGIGSGNNGGFEQSVGTFIDGVYFGRARNSRAAFLDLERVEVLKGPQSTLFGKNTVAGAINITTRGPTEEFEAFVEGGYETEVEEYEVTAGVSGPLSDTLRARLVGKYSDSEGWMDNLAVGKGPGAMDGPQRENSVVRGSLQWDASDRLTVSLKAEAGQFDVRGRANKITIAPAAAQYLFNSGGTDDNLAASLGFNNKQSAAGKPSRPEYDDTDARILQATLDYELGNATLRSISAWTEYDADGCIDPDYSSATFLDQCFEESHEQFTQEFLLSSEPGGGFDYIMGLYYQDADQDSASDTGLLFDGIPPIENALLGMLGLPLPSGALNSQSFHAFAQNTQTWSAFAQGTWYLTDRFRVTAGVRYSDDQKEADASQFVTEFGGSEPNPLLTAILGPAGLSFAAPYDYSLSRSEDHVTGSLNLQYDLGDGIMVYVTAANGYKAGGFDANNALDRSREFEDENVTNMEVGAKTEFWDRRARLNLALFDTRFDDLQVSSFEQASFVVTNAASAKSRGLEADLQLAATDYLDIHGAIAWMDAEYDDYEDAACTVDQIVAQGGGRCLQDLSGTPLQFAPDLSGNIGFTYDRPLTETTDIVLSLDALYSDDVLIMPDGDDKGIQSSYWKINARVAWQDSSGDWMVALVGKNLTDETTFNWGNDVSLSGTGFGFEGAYFHQIEKPRTYELQLRYNFY